MSDLPASLNRLFTVQSVIDILFVSVLVFALLLLFRGTSAVRIMRGVAIFFVVLYGIQLLVDLPAFNWILRNSVPLILVAIPVIFQSELREAFMRIGGQNRRPRTKNMQGSHIAAIECAKAIQSMSSRQCEATILFEGKDSLSAIADYGIPLNDELYSDLVTTIFYPGTALHTGAVVVRGNKVVAANCMLPGFESPKAGGDSTTRDPHFLDIIRGTDAFAVAVAQTGDIIYIRSGAIETIDAGRLRSILVDYFRQSASEPIPSMEPPKLGDRSGESL